MAEDQHHVYGTGQRQDAFYRLQRKGVRHRDGGRHPDGKRGCFQPLQPCVYTWKYGRQLASATDGIHTVTNAYDVDGIRKTKTVDGVEHDYVTLDGKIISETYGTVQVDYFYDNEGKPYKLKVYEIQNKIRHILQTAQKKAKGENHSQQAKR